jgi:WD40 repeat protein
LIAAACSDGRIRLWDTRAGHSIRQLSAFLGKDSGYASCIAIDDSGEWMIVGNSCRYSLIFHIPSGQVLRALPTKGITRSIGFLDYGRIVTVASDGVVYGWDLEGEPTFRIEVGYPLLHLDTWESSLLTCGASDKASFIPNVMFRPVQFHIHSPRS